MAEGNYEKLVQKISNVSGVEIEELDRRVEAKRAKLSGLISKEGAAQVIAAELGINFDNEQLKIDELVPSMRKVNVIGKVINLFPVRSFTTKKGDPGKVANLIIADETSNVKVVLWDTNHIELIESGNVKENVVIEISNGSMRDNEIHLGSFSEFKVSSEVLIGVQREKVVREKNLFDFKIGDSAQTRAFIVQSFEPRFFNVCSQCKKKVIEENGRFTCKEHGEVAPEKRALVNVVLDDGTETIRAVVFHDNLGELGLTAYEEPELLSQQRANLLGQELVFSGNVRRNNYFNNVEFVIDNVQKINFDDLIQNLEKKE